MGPVSCGLLLLSWMSLACASLTAPEADSRFQACGDGTVADLSHGLLWEQKRGEPGGEVFCDWVPDGCPDPHGVDQRYTWSTSGADLNSRVSGAHDDFLAALNGERSLPCFAKHCDWRLPQVHEWRTILIGPDAGSAQAKVCTSAPCIDPGFPDGARTSSGGYWSETRATHLRRSARFADFSNGRLPKIFEMTTLYVRAVRKGSCPH